MDVAVRSKIMGIVDEKSTERIDSYSAGNYQLLDADSERKIKMRKKSSTP
jgi:hypothetical protein